jgi:acyl-CoA dehydrogenase
MFPPWTASSVERSLHPGHLERDCRCGIDAYFQSAELQIDAPVKADRTGRVHPPTHEVSEARKPVPQAGSRLPHHPDLAARGPGDVNEGWEVAVMEHDRMVLDAAVRLFDDLADPQDVLRSPDDGWRARLWDAIESVGLADAWLPEELGGTSESLADGFDVAHAAGRFAVAAPVVETMLARWAAGAAKLRLPKGPAALIVPRRDIGTGAADGRSLRIDEPTVAFGRMAEHVVVVGRRGARAFVAVVPGAQCSITHSASIAGDPSDRVRIDLAGVEMVETPLPLAESARYMSATCRSLQMAGALEAILQMSVAYSLERVAFEKPIAKFQAVQQNLARLAGEVAAALSASRSAADAIASSNATDDALLLEVAAAKVRCGEAVELATGIAHQVFGAIGYTHEHVLHRFTLRALAWRDDCGSEEEWARRLGRALSTFDGTRLWHLLSSR